MTFTYHGTRLTECDDPYNATRDNERAVEIPVAKWFMSTSYGSGVEVGNVLAHYGCKTQRLIVDLFEPGTDVLNADVRDCTFVGLDFVVSVSTVEHVGWDDDHDPKAAVLALTHMRSFLKPEGTMLVTVPLGYNPPLDEALFAGTGTKRECTLVRERGRWHQTDHLTAKPYVGHGRGADAVFIGEYGGF